MKSRAGGWTLIRRLENVSAVRPANQKTDQLAQNHLKALAILNISKVWFIRQQTAARSGHQRSVAEYRMQIAGSPDMLIGQLSLGDH